MKPKKHSKTHELRRRKQVRRLRLNGQMLSTAPGYYRLNWFDAHVAAFLLDEPIRNLNLRRSGNQAAAPTDPDQTTHGAHSTD